MARLVRLVALLAACAASVAAPEARAWSLAQHLFRPAYDAGRESFARCADEHDLASGRYVVWVSVDSRTGTPSARVRDAPGPLGPGAEACIREGFEAPDYPSLGEALVAYTSGFRPPERYSVAFPLILDRHPFAYGFLRGDAPGLDVPVVLVPTARSRALGRRALQPEWVFERLRLLPSPP